MQGYELMPSGKNVLARRPAARRPHRRGGYGAFNPLKGLGKSAFRKVGAYFLALFQDVCGVVMVIGERRYDACPQPVRLGVGELESSHLLKVIIQQPGVVDQALQDQRFPSRHRAALAAQKRACRKLRTRRLIGSASDPWRGAVFGRSGRSTDSRLNWPPGAP